MDETSVSVHVSRRIAAPAPVIFAILADPRRHADFDGSEMLRGSAESEPLSGIGDQFVIAMHRLGRDYFMINHVVEFEQDRRLVWAPSPGDLETAGGDPTRVGVPAGYRWGFRLEPDGRDATVVTETFDCGTADNAWILERDGGAWINGHSSVTDSMSATLERLAECCRLSETDS